MLHCCDYTRANFAHSSLFPLSLSHTHTVISLSFTLSLSLFSLLQSIRSSKCRINQSVHRLALMSKSSVTLRPRPNQLTTGLRIQVSVCISLILFIQVCVCVCVMFRLVKRKASQVFHFIDSWRHIGQLYTYIIHARYTQCIWFDVLWHCHQSAFGNVRFHSLAAIE